MLLANCLIKHNFPENNYSLKLVTENNEARLKYLYVLLQYFNCIYKRIMDNLTGKDAAFSISNILEEGLNYDRKPGDWYGPSTMIQILEKLNTKYKPFPDLEIISFPESIIYIETIKNRISSKYTPLIIFVGYRLGLKQINPEYFASIIRIMEFKNFMGINGAQGNNSRIIL